MSEQAAIRALPQSALRFTDRLGRDLRRTLHVALAAPLASRAVFERLLRHAVRSTGNGEMRFLVPAVVARTHFGNTLQLEIPSAWIDQRLPDWIEHAGRRYNVNDFFLGAGDWSGLTHTFMDSTVATEAIELHEHKLDFRRTGAYHAYLSRMEAGQPVMRNRVRLASPELIEAYFARFVSLFRSIETHGLMRLADARRRTVQMSTAAGLRRWRADFAERDIGVAIGRSGEVYRLPGAQHRTAIALVLGIPRLPVEVRLVHADWLRGLYMPDCEGLATALRTGLAEFVPR